MKKINDRRKVLFIETIDVGLGELISAIQPDSLPDPIMYQYYKNLLKRKIIINNIIDDNLLETAVLPFMEMDGDGTGDQIEIILATDGGELYNGFMLVSVIENAKSPTTIHIMSLAASMGILIAMAGKNNPNVKTVCHPFSVGLLHSGSQYLAGTAHAVKDTFDFSQHYEDKIKDYILSHTKIDEKLYDKIDRKEYWMDANEMLRLGIVDEII